MKKILLVLMCVFTSLLFAGGLSFGVNAELAMPMGDFADVAKMGFGGTAQAEYGINEQIISTFSVGYLMFGEEIDGWKYTCIPIKAGTKYNIGESGLYGIFELGMYMFTVEWDFEFMGYEVTGDDSESEFGYAPGVGYQMPLGSMILDISAQYEIAGDFDFLGIDIGVRF